MRAKHKYILDAMNNDGARFVERVCISSTYYLEWVDTGRKEAISQDVYFTMSELGYIQLDWLNHTTEGRHKVTYRFYEDARGK